VQIAQITYSYKPITGGADVYAELLRRACEEAGHEVTVYQRPRQDVPDDRHVRFLDTPWRRLCGSKGEFWTLPFGLRRVRQELAAQDVLIVHYPHYHRFVEWHPATILLSHGVFWDDRPGALRSRLKRSLARRAYRKARAVVANDTFYLREMGEDVHPGAEPFSEVVPGRFFVPNAVDIERFDRTEPHPRLTNLQAIVVPRNLYYCRGVHLAIEAFALCAHQLGEARLVVVGADSQPKYRRQCEDAVRAGGLSDRVVFLGAIPWAEMPQVYSGAELTLIPTLCGEGTSLAALESMACGVATLSTNVAGLADLPTKQCQPTAAAMARALVTLWPRRLEVGAAQRKAVRETYHLSKWGKAWLGVIEGVARAG